MKQYCNQPGCPNEAAYRGKCAKHGRQAEAQEHDAGRRAFYTSKAWRQRRLRHLATQPFCACGAVGIDVDHIRPLELGGAPWADDNLQTLCKPCHGRKTREERRMGDTVPGNTGGKG